MGRMKTINSKRFTFSPFLQSEGAEVWTHEKRLAVASFYKKLARQLEMSVKIARADDQPLPPPALRKLPLRLLVRN